MQTLFDSYMKILNSDNPNVELLKEIREMYTVICNQLQ